MEGMHFFCLLYTTNYRRKTRNRIWRVLLLLIIHESLRFQMHWSPFTTNKNHKYFPDPEAFDPTRYEGDGPTSCTFLPFSAGPRMCPGKDYSMFLILVYVYNVVTRFKLQKLIQDEKMRYRVGPVPANGLPMRLQTHWDNMQFPFKFKNRYLVILNVSYLSTVMEKWDWQYESISIFVKLNSVRS